MRSLLHAFAAHGARMHIRNAALAILPLAPATAMPAPGELSAAQRPLHRERAPTDLCLSPLWQEQSTSSVFIPSSTIIGDTSSSRSRPSVVTRVRARAHRWASLENTETLPPRSDVRHEPVHPPVKDTVSRVAVAVAVAVAVSRVRVHRLAAISASGRERAQPLGLVPRVTHPSCSGGAPEHRSIPSVMASRPKGRQGSLI